MKKTLLFNKNILCFDKTPTEGLFENIKSLTRTYTNIEEEYNRLKQTEGDILGYYAGIQENNLGKEDATIMLQYVNAVRQSVYAAKAIKDIAHNLKDFDASANDIIHQQCLIIRNDWIAFDDVLNQLMNLSDEKKRYLEIEKLINDALAQEEMRKSEVILQLKNNQLNEVEASTLMNVHRELFSCSKSLLSALNNIEIETLTKPKL